MSNNNPNLTPLINFIDQANEDQRSRLNIIMDIVQTNDTNVSNAYFINGPGRIGTTFLYQCLINSCAILGFDFIGYDLIARKEK